MLISETFYSLQGEGELTGVPSVFIRTSGCNLRCNWCDTPYASWNPEGTDRSVDELVAEVRATPTRHVVLTGGEPMIAKNIRDLAQALREAGQHITIETAATVAPAGIACDLASMSPKLGNSAPDARLPEAWRARHEATRWNPDAVRAWVEVTRDGRKVTDIPRHKILLMPEAVSLEKMRERAAWLGELCKERGYRYAHRLHIELYGNKRGT